MRSRRRWLLALVAASTACEVGPSPASPPDPRQDGVDRVVRSLLGVRDLIRDTATDPNAAEDAIIELVEAPFGAAAVLAGPIELPQNTTMPGPSVTGSALPGCVAITDLTGGQPAPHGCERLETVGDGCALGDFSFAGRATRHCTFPDDQCLYEPGSAPGHAIAGWTCDYSWDAYVEYRPDPARVPLRATLTSSSPYAMISPNDMELAALMTFDVEELAASPSITYHGAFVVQTCGGLAFDSSCDHGTSPIAGTLLVQAVEGGSWPGAAIVAGSCARISATGCHASTIEQSCECPVYAGAAR